MIDISKIRLKKEEPKLIPNPKGKIAIIDGDVICFSSCPPRKTHVYHPDGTEVVILGEDGKVKQHPYTEEQEAAYLEEAWRNLKKTVEHIAETLWCDDVLIAVGGGQGNYRQRLFPEYKIHRHRENVFKNETVPILRTRLIEAGYAVSAHDYEADDWLRIWANEAKAIGQDYIICSIDKDLLCIPGEHYRMHKGKEQVITISEMDAKRHYYEQLIKGDPTDNIPGVAGIGPVKATKMLAGCNTEAEMQEVVTAAYYDYYGLEEGRTNLLINGKLIHILNYVGDSFTLDEWEIAEELK